MTVLTRLNSTLLQFWEVPDTDTNTCRLVMYLIPHLQPALHTNIPDLLTNTDSFALRLPFYLDRVSRIVRV